MIFRILIILSLSISALFCEVSNAREIMEKVYQRDDGNTLEQNMDMFLIDDKGQTRSRNIKTFIKDYDEDVYKIMFFNLPEDVKGSSFLTYDYEKNTKENEQWLYLPALKKIKRIPSSEKKSSFMGSDFSYFDMEKRNIDDYNYTYIKETTVRGEKVWVIESIPKNDKIVEISDYVKTIFFIRQDNYIVVRSIDFTSNGQMKYMDMKSMYQEKGIWLPTEISMTVKKSDAVIHSTVIKFSDIKINESVDDDLFTTRQLTKGY